MTASDARSRVLEAAEPKGATAPLYYATTVVEGIQAQQPREKLADYCVMLLQKPCSHGSVLNHARSIADYLNGTGVAHTDLLTADTFRGHFSACVGKLTPQVWYERQRHVLNFMRMVDPKDGARRAPAAKPRRHWHNNNPGWMTWDDLRKVWLRLDLYERVMFTLILSSLADGRELVNRPLDAIDQEGNVLLLSLPDNGRRQARHTALFFGEKSVTALLELAKDPAKRIRWLFPHPRDPTRHMDVSQLKHLLKSWGMRAGVPGISMRSLRTTMAAYLIGRGVAPQALAHMMGTTDMSRINRLRDQVLLAQKQGHLAGQPNFRQDAPAAGLLACEACGATDNGIDANYCARCGATLHDEAAMSEEVVIKAQMHSRLTRLLDLFGETAAKRIQDALAAEGTA